MNHDIVGINEKYVVAIIDKLTTNIEKLQSRFTDIDSSIEKLSVYKSESLDLFRKQYSNISLNYEIIKKNLMSYIEDLNKVVNNYKTTDKKSVDLLNLYSVEKQGK